MARTMRKAVAAVIVATSLTVGAGTLSACPASADIYVYVYGDGVYRFNTGGDDIHLFVG